MTNEEAGRLGEESAASYLCGKGFHILGRNVHSGHLETDIIAANDQYIVFAEVKTRQGISQWKPHLRATCRRGKSA